MSKSGRDELKFAERFSARMATVSSQMEEESQALGRWLLASALSVNGGALLLLFPNLKPQAHFRMAAAAVFALGMVSALAYGVIQLKVLSKSKIAVNAIIDNAEDVFIGAAERFQGKGEAAKIREAAKLASYAERCLYVSLGSFALGLIVSGISFFAR